MKVWNERALRWEYLLALLWTPVWLALLCAATAEALLAAARTYDDGDRFADALAWFGLAAILGVLVAIAVLSARPIAPLELW